MAAGDTPWTAATKPVGGDLVRDRHHRRRAHRLRLGHVGGHGVRRRDRATSSSAIAMLFATGLPGPLRRPRGQGGGHGLGPRRLLRLGGRPRGRRLHVRWRRLVPGGAPPRPGGAAALRHPGRRLAHLLPAGQGRAPRPHGRGRADGARRAVHPPRVLLHRRGHLGQRLRACAVGLLRPRHAHRRRPLRPGLERGRGPRARAPAAVALVGAADQPTHARRALARWREGRVDSRWRAWRQARAQRGVAPRRAPATAGGRRAPRALAGPAAGVAVEPVGSHLAGTARRPDREPQRRAGRRSSRHPDRAAQSAPTPRPRPGRPRARAHAVYRTYRGLGEAMRVAPEPVASAAARRWWPCALATTRREHAAPNYARNLRRVLAAGLDRRRGALVDAAGLPQLRPVLARGGAPAERGARDRAGPVHRRVGPRAPRGRDGGGQRGGHGPAPRRGLGVGRGLAGPAGLSR